MSKLKRLRNLFTGLFKHRHAWSHANKDGMKFCRKCWKRQQVKRRQPKTEGKS